MTDREPTRILILAACPRGTVPLRFDQELRDIQNGLESAKTSFTVRLHLATRPIDLSREILKFKPNLVHFCGHGDPEFGILLEDESGTPKPVSGEALASLFKLFVDIVRCVVLNCCYSRPQAEAIGQHISFVVGMNDLIGDDAAIAFSVGFYQALGEGRDEVFAFNYGLSRMQLENISEGQIPEIFTKAVQPVLPLSVSPPEPVFPPDRTRDLARKMGRGLFILVVLGASLLNGSLPRSFSVTAPSSETESVYIPPALASTMTPGRKKRKIPTPAPLNRPIASETSTSDNNSPPSRHLGLSSSLPGSKSTIEVIGVGFSLPSVEGERGKYLARRAAEVDARRNLAAMIETRIQSETTVVNGIPQSDEIKSTVDELVRGAQVKKERPLPDGGYEITLEVDRCSARWKSDECRS